MLVRPPWPPGAGKRMRMVLKAQSNPVPIVAAGKKIDRVVDISKSFPSFIWRTSGSHQIWLATLSAIVFGLTAAPLEIQRRVVNDAFKGGQFSTIFLLAGIYLALSLVSGLTKLALNVYRNRVGENVVRDLRTSIDQKIRIDITQQKAAEAEGVEMSLVVAESEPVGQFVGS